MSTSIVFSHCRTWVVVCESEGVCTVCVCMCGVRMYACVCLFVMYICGCVGVCLCAAGEKRDVTCVMIPAEYDPVRGSQAQILTRQLQNLVPILN